MDTEQLCLDFANTVDWHASDHPVEHLLTYTDLVLWAQKAGVLTDREAEHLSARAKRQPSVVTAVLNRALLLREAIYRILSAVAADRSPETKDLTILNGELPKALARLRLIKGGDALLWGWDENTTALDRMLWPVARSAAELLTSEKVVRMGQCPDDRGCGFLFLDMSRNRSRRWCDMRDCGNRAKVKRHYQRKRKADETPG
jgi:predicted RNA-binding Zn ribbon-like protein